MIFHEAQELWRSLKKVHSYILWGLTLNSYHRLWGGRGEEWKHSKLSEKPFFPILGISRALKSVWKVLWFLHIAHCTRCAGQPSPQAKPTKCTKRTNNRSLRNSWGAPTFTNIRTYYAKMFDVSRPPPPHITCHTNVSSTKDIKRVNKNIRRLLAVTGPCSWMRHNFSQFPR